MLFLAVTLGFFVENMREHIMDRKKEKIYIESLISDLKKEVESVKLDNEKRVCFYSLGAIIGLILDRANPNWRSMYFKEKFYLEKYF